MKTIQIVIIILISISFTSCAKKINPLEGYKAIKNKNATNLFENNSTEKTKIEANKSYKNTLTLNYSVLYYMDTITSNYHKYSIDLKPNKKYKIKISSLCDCAGFKKYMFIPEVYPENTVSETITIKLDSVYFNYEKGPLTLNKTWKINTETITKVTPFNFYLFSDNRKLGEKMHKFNATSIGLASNIIIPIVAPIVIKSTLVGKFHVIVEEK